MSWFRKDRSIIHGSGTLVLAADVVGEAGMRGITRLLFTGEHRDRNVLCAFAPSTGILWQTDLAANDDPTARPLTLGDDGALVTEGEVWGGTHRYRQPPLPTRHRGSVGRSWIQGWTFQHEVFPDFQVLQRDQANEHAWGVGLAESDGLHGLLTIGTGEYDGVVVVGELAVAMFHLDERAHWFLVARRPIELLGILRAEEESEFFHGGHRVWKGKL